MYALLLNELNFYIFICMNSFELKRKNMQYAICPSNALKVNYGKTKRSLTSINSDWLITGLSLVS